MTNLLNSGPSREEALSARRTGDRQTAFAHFQALSATRPMDANLHHEVGIELVALERFEEARAAFQQATLLAPSAFQSWRSLGHLAKRAKDYQLAVAYFEKAANANPLDSKSRVEMADSFVALGLLDRAETALRDALQLRPESADILLKLATHCRLQKKHSEALGLFHSAAKLLPENASIQHSIATEYATLDQLEDAKHAYRNAITLDPALFHAWRGLGNIARRRSNPQKAVEYFRQAVAIRRDDANVHVELATALLAIDAIDEAGTVLSQARQLAPSSAKILLMSASIARQTGQYEQALSLLKTTVIEHPATAAVHHDVAHEYLHLHQLEAAEAAFQSALELDPKFHHSLRGLGNLKRRQHDHQQSLWYYREAAKYLDQPKIKLEIAQQLVELKQYDEALEICERLLDQIALRHEALNLMQKIHQLQGRQRGAVALLEQAVVRFGDDVRLHVRLADEYLNQWRLADAETHFRSALALSKDEADALIGQGLVAKRRGQPGIAEKLFVHAARNGSRRANFELAKLTDEQKRPQEARAIIDGMLAEAPHDPSTLMQLGLHFRRTGQHSHASNAFGRVLALKPSHVPAYIEQSAEELHLGNVDRSLELLEAARTMAQENARVLNALAEARRLSDDLEGALELYGLALAADPTSIFSRLQMARCHAALGRAAAGLGMLDSLREFSGDVPEYYMTKAAILKQLGNLKQAKEYLVQGLHRYPEHFQIWFQRELLQIELDPDLAHKIDDLPPAPSDHPFRADVIAAVKAMARWDFKHAYRLFGHALSGKERDGWLQFRAAECALINLDIDGLRRHLRRVFEIDRGIKSLRGQALSISQSHLGQLLDDFVIEADAFQALTAAAKQTDDCIPALVRVVEEFPHYTAAAMLLLIAYRRAGAFSSTVFPDRHDRIPQSIIQFWDTEEVPGDLDAFSETWRQQNQGFDWRRYSAETAERFMRRNCDPSVAQAFDRARMPAMKADIFRLAVLSVQGGIYVDADDKCISTIAPLIESGASLVLYQEGIGSTGNNFIAAVPGHPVITEALRSVTDGINRGDLDIVWLSTGPGALTRALATCAAQSGTGWVNQLGVHLMERHQLHAYVAEHCLASYKHTRLHWSRTAYASKKRTHRGQKAQSG